MKTLFTLCLFATLFFSGNATIVVVTCQNSPSHFLPVTVNATVGDTIHWEWVAGTHVVGPITTSDIPVGAAMWNAPIDASHLTYDYVVNVAGNYHYVCHPATPHGEDGYIVVSAASGVPSYSANKFSIAYPNPFSDQITIETSSADMICLYNMAGEKIKLTPFEIGQTKAEVNTSGFNSGIYFYAIFKEGILLETRKLVKYK